ncbi:hypothetical protein Tco_1188165 [Tanacetum coccineum]
MSRTLGSKNNILVKLHDVPIKAFSEDGLIAIATKLGTLSEAFGSPNTTPLAEKIYNLERQIWYRKLVVVDDDGKPINKVDSMVNANSDSKMDEIVGTIEGKKVDDDYDPYDDDVYDGHDNSGVVHAICDDWDIKVRSRKKK